MRKIGFVVSYFVVGSVEPERVSNKVSVQGVVALGGHFAILCQELDFYEAEKNFMINFQKEKANT